MAKAVPRRIVPLGAGPRRLLKALGLQRRTVTVNDTLVGLPLVGEIRRAHPDLIVASSDTDPLDLARARTATHAAIYVEPDNSLEDVVEATGDVGLLTNQPVAARRVTAAIQRTRRAVAARLAGTPPVSVFVDTGDFSTVPSRSLLGDLITEAHGENVGGPEPRAWAVPAPPAHPARPGRLPGNRGQRTDARRSASPRRDEAAPGRQERPLRSLAAGYRRGRACRREVARRGRSDPAPGCVSLSSTR